MAANTTVLIVVAAIAALVLAGMIVGVAYKTRAPGRHVNGETIPDQAEQDALRLRRHQALADEYAARAHAAQVEIDIKTIRARRLQQQATVHRREAAASHDQLNEQRDSADKFGAAAHTRELPRPLDSRHSGLHNRVEMTPATPPLAAPRCPNFDFYSIKDMS